ncbi:MAG: hydrogenase maturation protease [Anaerolineae bacterium]
MELQSKEIVLVLGIGNLDRGDDGAGIAVVRRIRSMMLQGITVMEMSGEGTALVNLWETMKPHSVYIIDAMYCGVPTGSIERFDIHDSPLPQQFISDYSTHAFGLHHAIELARVLDCLPRKVTVYGIEGQCFDHGEPLTAEVKTATIKTVGLIMYELFA